MSFPRRTRHQHLFLVVFAAAMAPYAAAMQETAPVPSAAPRTVAVTPMGGTSAPARSVSAAQQQSLKLYDSLLGEAAGGGSLTEPVLVVPGKPMDGQALGQAVEDLSVMSRIIEKNALGEYATAGGFFGMVEYKGYNLSAWTGMGPATLFPSIGRAKPMYVGGYGALFFLQVNYPLLPPPEAPQEQPAGEQADPVWAEARRSVLDPQARPVLPQEGEPVEPYSREQVDALTTALITTLKHAANIRVLESNEGVTVIVQGVAPTPQTSAYAPIGAHAAMAPARRTVLILRATKADVDQYAKGQLDQQQFQQRVQIVTY